MTNFLKDLIKKEQSLDSIINSSIKIKDNITNNNGIHIYNTESSYKALYNGRLTFDFSNKNAWYWNKDIELRIKINDNLILSHSQEEEDKKEYNKIIHYEDNIKLIGKLVNKDNNEMDPEEELSSEDDEEKEFILVIQNVSLETSFYINLKKNDYIEWDIRISNKNSIDFDIYYQIDYINLLETLLNNDVGKNLLIKDRYENIIKKYISNKLYINNLKNKYKKLQYKLIDEKQHSKEFKILENHYNILNIDYNVLENNYKNIKKDNIDLKKMNDKFDKRYENIKEKITELNLINKSLSNDKNKLIKKLQNRNLELINKINDINNIKITNNSKNNFKKRIKSFEDKFKIVILKKRINDLNNTNKILRKKNKKLKKNDKNLKNLLNKMKI